MVVVGHVRDKYSVARRLIVESSRFDVDRTSLTGVCIPEMSISNVARTDRRVNIDCRLLREYRIVNTKLLCIG